jgi:Fic family protein
MMVDATQNFSQPLTDERLFRWHSALFPTKKSGTRNIETGRWRTDKNGRMQVVSGPIGRQKVHFEAVRAENIDEEIKLFLEWIENKDNLDPIIKAAIGHFWFVTIHPFDDGNGRICRAISDMLLARADENKLRCYSMSSQIEKDRDSYYINLEMHQRGTLDITGWILWFLNCLGKAINNADKKLNNIFITEEFWKKINKDPVNNRQKLIINKMLSDNFKGFINTSKYAKLANCSNDTALRDITELKTRKIFIQNPGRGRSTSYRLAEKIE